MALHETQRNATRARPIDDTLDGFFTGVAFVVVVGLLVLYGLGAIVWIR
jgi:hypothetical protein